MIEEALLTIFNDGTIDKSPNAAMFKGSTRRLHMTSIVR